MLTDCSSVTRCRRGSAEYAGRDADRTVVRLRGEHDTSTVDELSQTVARAIALDDGDLVIDLSGVEFMGAATIGVLVSASQALGLRTRSLTVRSPSTRAQRVLDVCGIDGQLNVTPAGRHPAAGTVVMFPTWE
jgi:anti-anti-sigma factor